MNCNSGEEKIPYAHFSLMNRERSIPLVLHLPLGVDECNTLSVSGQSVVAVVIVAPVAMRVASVFAL